MYSNTQIYSYNGFLSQLLVDADTELQTVNTWASRLLFFTKNQKLETHRCAVKPPQQALQHMGAGWGGVSDC